MSFKQLLHILWARRKTFLTLLFLIPGVVLAVCLLMPKEYRAIVSVVLDFKGVDRVSDRPSVALMPTVLVATETDIIKSHNVGIRVVDALGLDQNPTARKQFESEKQTGTMKDWLADVIVRRVEVEPSRDSSVLKIKFEGSDPQFSAAIANAFADAYIQASIDLKVQQAKQSASWYEGQLKELRDKLEKAQGGLSKYQQEHGIVSPDERIDVETSRLNELSNQLSMAQSQTYEALSRSAMAQAAQSGGRGLESAPEVVANSLIQNLKIELSRQDGKLSDLKARLGPQHPQVERARAEREETHERLNREIANISRSLANSADISKHREADLRGAVAKQKERVMQIKQHRDELAVLMREVDTAQKIYDNAIVRGDQQRLESQSNLTNISILNPAIPPTKHSSPNTLLFTLIALLLAPFAATAVALAFEAFDRRVRSSDDLVNALNLPVLATIGRSTPTRLHKMLAWARHKRPAMRRRLFSEPIIDVPEEAIISEGR